MKKAASAAPDSTASSAASVLFAYVTPRCAEMSPSLIPSASRRTSASSTAVSSDR